MDGSRLCAALIADCTSSSAISMLNVRLNCRTMTEVPGAGGSHLAQALQLAELTLERRGYCGCDHRRACSGIKREDLNGGIVHLRQRGDGQLRIADDADQQDCGHQQRSSHRPQNKRTRGIHGALLPLAPFVLAGGGGFETTTAILSCN